MTALAATPTQLAAGQIALAAVLAAAGVFLLLPRPQGRSVAGGIAAVLAAVAVFGAWLNEAFGEPATDWVGNVLFVLFAAGSLGFGTVLVAQRNPARGAIAFAFVILSTCGLFLLLAAPFLMAATIIIYAGAIVVTFLFVLMLSPAGPSDENDRTREPLLGGLAGFAFVGLVLFTLYQTRQSVSAAPTADQPAAPLPAPVLTPEERQQLADIAAKLRQAEDEKIHTDLTPGAGRRAELKEYLEQIETALEDVVGVSPDKQEGVIRDGSIATRLRRPGIVDERSGEFFRSDPQALALVERVKQVRKLNYETFRAIDNAVLFARNPDVAAGKERLRRLREAVALLQGEGQLPARNVGNLGVLLYTQHLLAVELAGTLLLVATIGAVAIAHRKAVPQ